MKTIRQSGWYALGLNAVLLAAPSAWAQCPNADGLSASGDDLVIQMKGKQSTAQRVLVIPVVDDSFAYNPAARQFAGSAFEAQLALIQSQYAQVASYWQEASYGNVALEGVIPTCFYQVPTTFPTVGEDAFQRALLITADVNAFGTAYTSVTLKYVSDPAEGEKTLTFTSDGASVADPEAVVAHLREQLGTAANEVEIELAEQTISTTRSLSRSSSRARSSAARSGSIGCSTPIVA